MDILIIGNGFDLAHDLDTKYKDFLDYCEKLSSGNELCSCNLWLKHFITKTKQKGLGGDTWIDLETEIYEVIKKLNIYDSYSFPKVLKFYKSNMEFDFSKIGEYFYKPHHHLLGSEVGVKEYLDNYKQNPSVSRNNIKQVYIATSKGFINFLYDQLRDFTRAFETYLSEEINTQSTGSKYKLNLPASSQNTLTVISFNYTDTCERFYNSDFKLEPIYVHGKADIGSDDCNLVLGTHSFDRTNNGVDNKLSMDLNVFQKHNQRHKYDTIEAYQDFAKILADKKKQIHPVLHVIGHSLDETDHKILNHIFTVNKNIKRINIYYHDEEAQEKLINNITEIIGEAEVIAKVRLIRQHDEKRGLLRPIKE